MRNRTLVSTVHVPDCALFLSGDRKRFLLTFLQLWWSGNSLLAILEDSPFVPIYVSGTFEAMSLGILQVHQSTAFYSREEKMFSSPCIFW